MTFNIDILYQLFLNSKGVSIDTRTLKAGEIFFAIKGPSFNGNLFAMRALEMGASAVVVDEDLNVLDSRIFKTENVLEALQLLAKHHRQQLNVPVIAICGSNGKTTTKELTASVLSESYQVFYTKGNLNNHIGVPLSLLSIHADHQIAIIEIGANHLNETKFLCEIAQPTHGLITNNGKDHLEGYGSLEGVRKGNAELFDYLKLFNGVAFISSFQTDLVLWIKELNAFSYGSNPDDFLKGIILENFPSLKIEIQNENNSIVIDSNIYGEYNFENLLAASCIGRLFNVPLEKIKTGIEKYFPANNRSQILKRDSNTFILDAYNANPSSMMAALKSFEKLDTDSKVIVLGDMLELGSFSEAEHQNIYQLCLGIKSDKRIFVGPEFSKVVKANDTDLCFKNISEAHDWLTHQQFSNTIFLLKASRGIALEKIL